MGGERRPARFGNGGHAVGLGQDQQSRTGPQQARGVIERERQAEIVRWRGRIPAHQRIEHAQCAARTGSRRHWRFRHAAADDGDAIALAHRLPRGHGTCTRRLHRLEAGTRAEVQQRRRIGDEERQPFALGLEQLGMRATTARRQPPVDVAYVVAGDVLA